jgi:hypothetical protein
MSVTFFVAAAESLVMFVNEFVLSIEMAVQKYRANYFVRKLRAATRSMYVAEFFVQPYIDYSMIVFLYSLIIKKLALLSRVIFLFRSFDDTGYCIFYLSHLSPNEKTRVLYQHLIQTSAIVNDLYVPFIRKHIVKRTISLPVRPFQR